MKGIYKITCVSTGIVYIGSSTVDFKRRWAKHRQRLRYNYHENSYLQSAWDKYGESNFSFDVVEDLTLAHNYFIKERERYWLSYYFSKGRDFCFNLSDHTDGGNTLKTDEIKKKHHDNLKKSYTKELRQKRREEAISRNLIIKAREKIGTDGWRKAHLDGVRKLAKDINWLEKMKAVNKHKQIQVGTDRGEIFESVAEAARETGAMRANIRSCIKGNIKSCMKRKWFYFGHKGAAGFTCDKLPFERAK